VVAIGRVENTLRRAAAIVGLLLLKHKDCRLQGLIRTLIAEPKVTFYTMPSLGIKKNPENFRQTHILSALAPSHLTTVAYALDASSYLVNPCAPACHPFGFAQGRL
jgi:hypothetical protein